MILVTHWVEPEVLGRLSAAAPVEANATRETWPAADLARRAARATAMMAFMPDAVDAAFLEGAPGLRIVACALKGFDNFDVAACTARGVWVSIVPDLLTEPTAELAVGLAIALGRNIRAGDALVRSGRFAGWRPVLYGQGLAGAEVGILGHGAVGRAVEARLAGFGCAAVRHHDPGSPESVPLDELLARSDLVLGCAPLTAATRHLVGAERLARIKPGALLVNVGRGSVVDERAALAALDSGRLGGFAADVFEFEDWALPDRPREILPALREHPRALWTPHLGSAVREVRRAIAERAADNILDWYQGRPPRDAINAPASPPA
jgi:phosphonate dehydrogenase